MNKTPFNPLHDTTQNFVALFIALIVTINVFFKLQPYILQSEEAFAKDTLDPELSGTQPTPGPQHRRIPFHVVSGKYLGISPKLYI